MIDFKLDPNTHDLIVSDFTFETTRIREEEVSQRLKILLLFFKEEWFLDENYGIPYFQEIFKKNVNLSKVDDIFKMAISNEDGVQDLLTYSSSYNPYARSFSVNGKVLLESGEIVPFSIEV